MSEEAYKAIEAAAHRFTQAYKLEPRFAYVGIKPGLTTIHVMIVRGKEHLMPDLPETFEDYFVTSSKIGTIRSCAA